MRIEGYSNPSNLADPGGFEVIYRTAEQVETQRDDSNRTATIRRRVLEYVHKEGARGRLVPSGNAIITGIGEDKGKGKGKGFRKRDLLDAIKVLCGTAGGVTAELEPCGGFDAKGCARGPFRITDKGKAWLATADKPKPGSLVDCPKCGGDGVLPDFPHINNGKCTRCSASGKVAWTPAIADELRARVADAAGGMVDPLDV